MPRIATRGTTEGLTGRVCVCSLGRVGVVTGRTVINFPNGDTRDCWVGMGFDGNGVWATGVDQDIVVLFDTLAEYVDKIKTRPNNLSYGKMAVTWGK
jgi:hypothetical protein